MKVYYAGTKKKSGLSEAELEELWGSISSKQQKKIAADHSKKLSDYSEIFEKYVRVRMKKKKKYISDCIFNDFCNFYKLESETGELGKDDGDH